MTELLFDLNAVEVAKKFLPAGIVATSIAINNECNLACKHCYLYAPERYGSGQIEFRKIPRETFTTQRAVEIADDSRGVVSLFVIPAMEPLLTDTSRETVDHVAKTLSDTTKVGLVTNAINAPRLNSEQVHSLADNLDFLSISFESGDQEYHDSIRGEKSFQRSIQGLESLINRGIPEKKISLQATILPERKIEIGRQVESLLQLAKNYSIRKIAITPFITSYFSNFPTEITRPSYYKNIVFQIHRALSAWDKVNRQNTTPLVTIYTSYESPMAVVGFSDFLREKRITKDLLKFNALEISAYAQIPDFENIDFRVEIAPFPIEESMYPRIIASQGKTSHSFKSGEQFDKGSGITYCFGLERNLDETFGYWVPGYIKGVNDILMNKNDELIDRALSLSHNSEKVSPNSEISKEEYLYSCASVAVQRFLSRTRELLSTYNALCN